MFLAEMTTGKEAQYWESMTRKLARQVNASWWLEHWLPWLMGAGIVGSTTLLWLRWRAMGSVAIQWFWIALAAAGLVSMLGAWWWARRRFESVDAARVRLEDSLKMKTVLTAAHAGIVPWPAEREIVQWPLRTVWTRPAAVAIFTATMLALAAWVPIPAAALARQRTIEKPAALEDVEKWMDQVRQQDAAEEESVQKVEEKVAELLQRPAENWYEHGTLEAADHLKEQTTDMLRDLARNLTEAERAAAALEAAGQALPKATRDALSDALDSSLQGLKGGGMKPSADLMKQLQGMSAEQLSSSLSPEQMKQMADALSKNRQALEDALNKSPSLNWDDMVSNMPGKGQGDGQGSGPDGSNEGLGKGGVSRGPGTGPVGLKQDPTKIDTTKPEQLQSQIDLERMAPGDLITTTDGKHKTDESYRGPGSSGAAAKPGDGGAAVWQNSLVPTERQTLQRYFKQP